MSIPFLKSELSLLILLSTFKKINDFCLIVFQQSQEVLSNLKVLSERIFRGSL